MDNPQPTRRPNNVFKRQYIINPGFQLELTAYFTGALTITLGGFYMGYKHVLSQTDMSCEIVGSVGAVACRQILGSQGEMMRSIFILSLILGLIFVMAGGVLLSHRAAGPLFRLKKYFSDISSGGKVVPLTFRKNDYFQDVTEVINSALDKITKK